MYWRPKDCSDGDPCTLDLCSNGILPNPPNHGECFDGNHCLRGKTCQRSVRWWYTSKLRDYNECTADSCEPSVGCVHTPLSGKICDDHSVLRATAVMTRECAPGSNLFATTATTVQKTYVTRFLGAFTDQTR